MFRNSKKAKAKAEAAAWQAHLAAAHARADKMLAAQDELAARLRTPQLDARSAARDARIGAALDELHAGLRTPLWPEA